MGGIGHPERCVMCLEKSAPVGDIGRVCNLADNYTLAVNSGPDRPRSIKIYQTGRTTKTRRSKRREFDVIPISSSARIHPHLKSHLVAM